MCNKVEHKNQWWKWYGVLTCGACGTRVEIETALAGEQPISESHCLINNTPVTAPAGAVAWKYADALEAARWIFDLAEAQDIAREDLSLIEWVSETALPLTS